MPSQIKGPGLFLAQFAGDEAPFDSLENITKWAAGLGYKGVQIPTFDGRLFDLNKAAESDAYCDEVKDYTSREIFRRILESEEEHIDWLETQLEMISQMGIQNYIQLQSGAE